jgi:hypothetical protein
MEFSFSFITIVDIIHRLVFYLKHYVSKIVFCLRLQMETAQLGPINLSGDRD